METGCTSFRKIVNASPTYGTESSGTNSLTCSTSAAVPRGLNMTGPLPFTMSKGIFIPDRGVRMSENKMTYHNQCERNLIRDNNQLFQREKRSIT